MLHFISIINLLIELENYLSLTYMYAYIFFDECVRVSTAVMNHHNKNILGRKGLLCLTLPHHSSSLKDVKTRRKSNRARPGDRC